MGRYDLIEKKKTSWLKPALLAILLVVIIGMIFIFILPQGTVKTAKDSSDQFMEILEVPSGNTNPETNQDTARGKPVPGEQVTDNTRPLKSIALPPLDKSDAIFRTDLTSLSLGLSTWLGTDNLIRKLLVITNDFSQGLRLYKHFRFFKLEKPFIAKESPRGLYMSRESYQRYDQLTAAINAMDIKQSLALYQKYTPLFQQVFATFGYPETYQLDDIFKKAAAQILAAPVIKGQIRLVRPTVRYKFHDPKLEALDPVQKQMLRMGPENTQTIQNKLRLFVQAMSNIEQA